MIKVPTQSSSKGNVLYISVGVSGSVIVLIVAVINITIVTICLRKRVNKKLLNTADNVAYGVKQEDNLTDNLAYSATTSGEDGLVYDYVITADDDDINIDNLTDNLAYSATTSGEDGLVYDYIITADDDDINNIASTPNEAYGMTSNVST